MKITVLFILLGAGITCTQAQVQKQTPTLKADTIIAALDQHPPLKLNQPLCFVNGKKVSADTLKTLNPDMVESIEVVNRPEAEKKYGEAGKNGALLIKLKDIARKKED